MQKRMKMCPDTFKDADSGKLGNQGNVETTGKRFTNGGQTQ